MKAVRRGINWLLLVLMLINMLPAPAALAADGESVLDSINHTDAAGSQWDDSRHITLYVAYGSTAQYIDLSSGLTISYDQSRYKAVVINAPADPRLEVDKRDYVQFTVSYNLAEEEDGIAKSKTEYYIRALKKAQTPAEFHGNITMEIQAGQSVPLNPADFTDKYLQNEGDEFGYIIIRGTNLAVGTLKYSGATGDSPYEFGAEINVNDIDKLFFQATSVTGTVSYDVEAYDVTGKKVGTAVLTVIVRENSPPDITKPISETIYKGSDFTFSSLYILNRCNTFGWPLKSVTITPLGNDCGTWYLGGSLFTGQTEIPAEQLNQLKFTATAEGEAAFTWKVTTLAGTSEMEDGTFTVVAPSITLSPYSVSSGVKKGDTWQVSASHFRHAPSDVPLKYIKITAVPATAYGQLYLTTALAQNKDKGYSAIAANTALKTGAIIPIEYANYLRLATKSTSTGNSIFFEWTATADNNAGTATWAQPVSYSVGFITSGTVTYNTYMNVPVDLDAEDFSSRFYSSTGRYLSYVTFKPPAKTSGTLYYNYDIVSKKGTAVTASQKYYTGSSPNLSQLTFVPAAGFTGSVSITFTAYGTDGSSFSGTLEIEVSNSSGGTVIYTVDKNSEVQLDGADFAAAFLDSTGKELSYVVFSLPSSSYGRLYYNYESPTSYESTVSSSKKYYVYSSPYVSYVTFVPYEDYTGTVTVNYTAYNSSGSRYSGKLVILVVDSPAGIVSYNSKVNGYVQLSGEDFAREFISVTGSVLSYVQFTAPPADSGALYYEYSPEAGTGTKVASSAKYYYKNSSPEISGITFVPAKDFVGLVEIKYTAYTASGASYAGKLKIKVGETSSGSISYATGMNTPLEFKASDFSSRFYTNTGGSILSYVVFSLPPSAYGELRYGYTSSASAGSPVAAGTKYYVKSSPYLSNVVFIPKAGYSGSFTISYTGYDEKGTGYPGKIHITVESAQGTVNYKTAPSTPVKFNSTDFTRAFAELAQGSLSYVKFSLPSASEGALYYGYVSSSNPGSAVSYTTKYYANSWPYLSSITFVPAKGFTGTVVLDYTAYNSSGEDFPGTVMITVTEHSGGTVYYETVMNKPVALDSDDFNSAFLGETGSSLYSVQFKLPSSNQGTLYYGYTSPTEYGSKVRATTRYFKSSSPLLSNISFVPNPSFSGKVNISYTAYTSSGKSYSGLLVVDVRSPFADLESGYSWAAEAISHLYNKNIVTGTGNGLFMPGRNMSRGNFMLMVYRAFSLKAPASGNFPDVKYGSYYYDAIAAAKALGIAQGINGKFYPDSHISRQDAMVIIARTLEIMGKPLPAGSDRDLSPFADAGSVSDYARGAVSALVKAGIVSGNGGYLYPKNMISRAEMAVLLHRVLAL
ncbi:MAG: S-layer homology domain-containing protein [Oscillospiraceae bacterium]